VQVSDVDVTVNKIATVLFTDSAKVPLREDLDKSLDKRVSREIQDKLIAAISQLMTKAAAFHPEACHGIATESLRLAKNSDAILARIKNETGLPVTTISQEEEGILGFISAVNEADIDLDKAISWDLGGGSLQITTRSGDSYSVYQGRLGKVPMKNALVRIQGKDSEKTVSPNPISPSEADQAFQFIKDNVKNIPETLREKLNRPDTVVLGIGIHPLWGMPQNEYFDCKRLLEELKSRLNLDDEAVGIKDSILKEYSPYRVSNLILAYGIMEALNINQVRYVGTQGANAMGTLLSPKYWE
jgi:exopolyphosphatase/guanosine-5'-triphosphate,3'-diphosphate pyrophosphatase